MRVATTLLPFDLQRDRRQHACSPVERRLGLFELTAYPSPPPPPPHRSARRSLQLSPPHHHLPFLPLRASSASAPILSYRRAAGRTHHPIHHAATHIFSCCPPPRLHPVDQPRVSSSSPRPRVRLGQANLFDIILIPFHHLRLSLSSLSTLSLYPSPSPASSILPIISIAIFVATTLPLLQLRYPFSKSL